MRQRLEAMNGNATPPDGKARSEEQSLSEVPVFKPGDLIHGTLYSKLISILYYGITIPKEASYGIPLASFCMFPDHPEPTIRYSYGDHKGPRAKAGDLSRLLASGVIVDRERLLAALPEQVYAVGYNFSIGQVDVQYRQVHELYPFSDQNQSVFGIPIFRGRSLRGRNSFSSWKSEVRVYEPDPPDTNKKYNIPPSTIRGLVIDEAVWNNNTILSTVLQRQLLETFGSVENIPSIYVLSPEGKILASDLKEIVRIYFYTFLDYF